MSITCLAEFGPNVIYHGDIFDLANCEKKRVAEVRRHQAEFMKHGEDAGAVFIHGNHCLLDIEDGHYVFQGDHGKVLCLHGDYQARGAEWARRYRSREPGTSWFKRTFWVNALEAIEQGWGPKPSKELVTNCVAEAKKAGCYAVVIGHCHFKKLYFITQDGVLFVGLPRGRTELNL